MTLAQPSFISGLVSILQHYQMEWFASRFSESHE